MPLTIVLNGERRTFDALEPGATLAQLVAALELKPDRIALEQNGELASGGAGGLREWRPVTGLSWFILWVEEASPLSATRTVHNMCYRT